MSSLQNRPHDSAKAVRLLATLERLLASEAIELRPAMMEASQLLAEVLAADKVDVFLFDPSNTSLVAVGTSDTPMGRKQHALGLNLLPLANGGRAVMTYRSGMPFLTGHTEDDPDEVPGIRDALAVRSSLLVPLEVQDQRRGVLSVTSAQPDYFDAADLDFVNAAARWLGNLTHRLELVEQVRRETAAEARRETADELMTVLAHDLRTPLTPLFGYAEMIHAAAERDGQTTTARAAVAMTRGLARLRRMIDNLLDASRLEQGLFMVTPEAVDVVQLVRQGIESTGLADSRIVMHSPETLVGSADPTMMLQILENLLSNAHRHAPPDGTITVRVETEAHADEEWVVISVQDGGPGITLDLLPHIFTRYKRDSSSAGLGLGLYLAHGIATAHSGTLTVESTPGSGATFRLRFPRMGMALRERNVAD